MLYYPRTFPAVAAAILLSGLVVTAQEKPQDAAVRSTYHLGPEDQIVLRVSNVPDINDKPVRIDNEGYIKLPMIGRVKAGGLTAEQLEAEIAKGLKVYLEQPEVAVTVGELHSQPVSVIGAVGTPGVHQLQGHKTLVEILSLAGGLRPDAGPSAKITRRLEWGQIPLPGAKDDPTGQFSIAEVNLRMVIEAKSPEKNIPVLPQDVISVPRAEMVYVLGDVTRAGVLPLNDGDAISVLEAISTSGGLLRTASTGHAKILRPVKGEARRTEMPIDLRKIQTGKADDVMLLAGDILFVPGSNSKRMSVKAIEAAVQVGTMALTYGVIR